MEITRKFDFTRRSARTSGIALAVLVSLFWMSAVPCSADTRKMTYLENSANELTIYFITGREPGATMMIIGGIQGDEPGGYLSADLYADILLEKGNLIVVPRANFNSIRMNQRGVNGDMNRRFSIPAKTSEDMDQRIVDILKSLMLQSTVLLNLHDGSGFYSPTYISASRNPGMFGQSIIADAARYMGKDSTMIDLEGTARRIIEQVNLNIKDPNHRFQFNNHNTVSPKTKHPEQRQSATYFALTQAGIPAFGIETAKSIAPVSSKVKYQTLVINAFMADYGIVPEHPNVSLPEPELDYLVIQVDGDNHHFAVKNGETLLVPKGSSVHFTDIVANYQRGLSLDVVGFGDVNDFSQVVVINRPTMVNVYKDSFLCGKIAISFDSSSPPDAGSQKIVNLSEGNPDYVMFTIDGKNTVVSLGDTLHIVRGDSLVIADAQAGNRPDGGFRVNFVGYVGNKQVNDAEDRGYRIDTGRDLLDRFSQGGSLYQVDIESIAANSRIGSVFIRIHEPKVEYLIVEREDGTRLAFPPGSVVPCAQDEEFKIISVITNITASPFVDMFVSRLNQGESKVSLPQVLKSSTGTEIRFRRSSNDLGSIYFGTRG